MNLTFHLIHVVVDTTQEIVSYIICTQRKVHRISCHKIELKMERKKKLINFCKIEVNEKKTIKPFTCLVRVRASVRGDQKCIG